MIAFSGQIDLYTLKKYSLLCTRMVFIVLHEYLGIYKQHYEHTLEKLSKLLNL